MAEWIGHFIANWPIWLVIPIAFLVGIVWLFLNPYTGLAFGTSSNKYEWPEDKKKRLARQKARRESLNKVKASLKLKKG